MKHRKNKILVTGGSGMLGHAVISKLNTIPEFSVLAPTRTDLDLCDASAVEDFWNLHQPNLVIHLAGFVKGILGNLIAGSESLIINAKIQSNLLQAAIAQPPEAFVVAGTVAAYAYPYISLPLNESDFWNGSPHTSEGFYAAGKRVAIPYLEGLSQMGSGTRFAILTNLFGAFDHFGETGAHVVPSLISRFVDAERSNLEIVKVWGDRATTRDFLFSEDAAQYLVDLLISARVIRDFECVNVASGKETSMLELAELIRQKSGFAGGIEFDKDAPIGIPRRSINISKLRRTSTHVPTPLEVGLERTIDWYSSLNS